MSRRSRVRPKADTRCRTAGACNVAAAGINSTAAGTGGSRTAFGIRARCAGRTDAVFQIIPGAASGGVCNTLAV